MSSLSILILSIFRVICIFILIVLAAFFSIFSMIINPPGYVSFLILKIFGKLILLAGGVKVNCCGLDNISKTKNQVFAVNHSSHFDVPVIYSVFPVQVGWLAKRELFRIPFLGWLMKANKFISIDRGKGKDALKSLNAAVEKVLLGAKIIIFPEGTRSLDGKLQPFKKLLFRLCLKTGVPIVPVYIKGTHDVLKAGTFLIKPGRVFIKIGEEIDTDKYQPNKVMDLMNELRDKMLNLQEDILRYKELN